jgi:CDP-diacylglycerol--serine O-phosphatidyltransferase
MDEATKPKHFSMIREFHVADFFTLANAACGMAAIFNAMTFMATRDMGAFWWAVAFAPAAFVCDILDGRIARMRHETSILGRELDSLADVISFGVAPAALAMAAGLNGGFDWICLIYFVCCGVSRLARFNVTAEKLAGDGGKVKYFEGTPIPTSVVLTGVLAIEGWLGRVPDQLHGGSFHIGTWELHLLSLLFVASGSLMISKTLRIPKF